MKPPDEKPIPPASRIRLTLRPKHITPDHGLLITQIIQVDRDANRVRHVRISLTDEELTALRALGIEEQT